MAQVHGLERMVIIIQVISRMESFMVRVLLYLQMGLNILVNSVKGKEWICNLYN